MNLEKYLDAAEKDFVLHNKTDFQFLIRRDSKLVEFYSLLESEIRLQSLLQVKKYRLVKEGWTQVSRPAEVGFGVSELLACRPYVKSLKQQLQDLLVRFSTVFKSGDFARGLVIEQFENTNRKWPTNKVLETEESIFNLENFFEKNYAEVTKNIETTKSCLEVFSYLMQNKKQLQGMTAKQIPHGQSTKLMGKESLLLRLFQHWDSNLTQWRDVYHYLRLHRRSVEYRFYAPVCFRQSAELKKFHGVFSSELLPEYDFSTLSSTLIIENLESFFQAVQWLENNAAKNILIIWGGGWRVASLARYIELLPGTKYYWGDMDKEGYEIYGFLKSRFQPLLPLGMSYKDFEENKSLQQTKEKYFGPLAKVPDLQTEYEYVCHQGLRIEQEHVSIDAVLEIFRIYTNSTK